MKRENGQDEADDGNDAAYIRDDLQGDLMGDVQPDGVHVHQHSEVRQVIAFAHGVSFVGLLYLASLVRPSAVGNKVSRVEEIVIVHVIVTFPSDI